MCVEMSASATRVLDAWFAAENAAAAANSRADGPGPHVYNWQRQDGARYSGREKSIGYIRARAPTRIHE